MEAASEMTEREKMINGALYDPSDPELEQLRLNARKLARKYNRTDEDQPEEQAEILRKLLPATKQSQLHRAKCMLAKRIKEYTEYERKR